MHRVRVVAGVGAWLTAVVSVSLVTGVARWSLAWLAMGVLFLVVPSQMAWQLTPDGARRRVPVGLALGAGLALGLATFAITPLSTAELRAVEDRLIVPDSWRRIGSSTAGGNLCLDGCPTVTARWLAARGPGPAAVEAVAVFRGAGFRVVVTEDGPRTMIRATSGRVEATATVAAAEDASGRRTEVQIALTSRSPSAG